MDVIILATGFDAGSGALTRIDIRGKEGRALKEEWSQEIRTAMGLQVHGYPNLFTTGAPLAPSAALCNMTTACSSRLGGLLTSFSLHGINTRAWWSRRRSFRMLGWNIMTK